MPLRPRTEHALVYSTRTAFNRQSAVIFTDTGHALASITVLMHCLPGKTAKRLATTILSNQFVDVNAPNAPSDCWAELRNIPLQLIHKTEERRTLQTSSARIRYVFNCENISECMQTLLDGFESTKPSSDSDTGLGHCAMSAFVVLHIVDHPERDSTAAAADDNLRRRFEEAARHEKDMNCIRFRSVRRLDRIATVTTPFGNEVFFGALNEGSVANVFGRNDCVFVASQHLAAGCEGGAVYNARLELIGLIISTTFQWNRTENASMTLVANFAEIVAEFLRKSALCDRRLHVEQIMPLGSKLSRSKLEKCVLLIEVGGCSGSGCFVRVNGERFILTCAHVVANAKSTDTSKVHCTWHGGTFTTRILYRNARFGRAYDVALLQAPPASDASSSSPGDDAFTTFASAAPRVGDVVFAVGFPHFFALAKRQFAPSLLEGRLTNVLAEQNMLCTDASVQAGQSGGPLLDAAGRLVGVVVSNARDAASGRIYPHVNMCVPGGVIETAIVAFTRTKDVRELDDRLQASDEVASYWNLQPVVLKSKM